MPFLAALVVLGAIVVYVVRRQTSAAPSLQPASTKWKQVPGVFQGLVKMYHVPPNTRFRTSRAPGTDFSSVKTMATNVTLYPDGAALPSDWPSDDLGFHADRIEGVTTSDLWTGDPGGVNIFVPDTAPQPTAL